MEVNGNFNSFNNVMGRKYGSCCKTVHSVEQVQLKDFRVFLDVNRHHPKSSMEMEMDMLPFEWATKKR